MQLSSPSDRQVGVVRFEVNIVELLTPITDEYNPKFPLARLSELQTAEKDAPEERKHPEHHRKGNGGILDVGAVPKRENPRQEKLQHGESTNEIIKQDPSKTNKLTRENAPEKLSFVSPFFEVGILLR